MPEIKLQNISAFRNMPPNERENKNRIIKETLERKEECRQRGYHIVYADEAAKGYYDAMNCMDCQGGFSEDTLNNEGLKYVAIPRTRFN